LLQEPAEARLASLHACFRLEALFELVEDEGRQLSFTGNHEGNRSRLQFLRIPAAVNVARQVAAALVMH
jgi:hypothetical protein